MIGNIKDIYLRKLAVRANVSIGDRFHVGPGSVVWAPTHLTIGNDVYVGKHVTIEVDGEIGDGVLFANGCGVVGRRDHDYQEVGQTVRRSAWVGDTPSLSAPVSVGSDVWVGFNAVVQSGIKVGNSVVIAAGSVVTKDIPDNTVVAGTPARAIRQRFDSETFEKHWNLLRSRGTRWMS